MKNSQTNASFKSSQIELEKYRIVMGRHIYGNLDDIRNKEILTDLDGISEMVLKAVSLGGMHVVKVLKYKFPDRGQGVSVIALLEESHLSVHTWPEGEYATVDIYSCGERSNPLLAFNYIVKTLDSKKCQQFYMDRSK